MTIRLHRGRFEGMKRGHPCWRVEEALRDAGVAYEIVVEPTFPRGRRGAVIEGTGQNRLPALQLEDGTWWRDESAAMARAIAAGRLGGDAKA